MRLLYKFCRAVVCCFCLSSCYITALAPDNQADEIGLCSDGVLAPADALSSSAVSLSADVHTEKQVLPAAINVYATTPAKRKSAEVRVLLDDSARSMNKTWPIRSSAGFLLINTKNSEQKIVLDAQDLFIQCCDGTIHINGKLLTKDQVVIKARDGTISFEGKQYGGSFYIICKQEHAYLINSIDLEDYVCSVIGAEGWPSWSAESESNNELAVEINSVLAIAVRTYCLSMMREAVAKKRVYHLSNKIAHQVYSGVHHNKNIHDAVQQTAGLIMTYDNKPITAMYHACCGGVIPAKISGIDFRKAPYLGRTKQCRFCKNCTVYDWTAEFKKDDLSKYLSPLIPNRALISSVHISKKDLAGKVKEIEIKTSGVAYKVSSDEINKLPGVKSHYYGIQLLPKKVLFKGRGCGHRVGLCQWGAYGMAKEGWGYKKILDFYYPGISIKKIVV